MLFAPVVQRYLSIRAKKDSEESNKGTPYDAINSIPVIFVFTPFYYKTNCSIWIHSDLLYQLYRKDICLSDTDIQVNEKIDSWNHKIYSSN